MESNAGVWSHTLQDGLGSVRGVVSDALAVQESRLYAPYGQPFGVTGTEQTAFGFTGEWTDANELVHLRARYYAPGIGIFASLDPFEGTAQRPMSLNRYSWVEGNTPNDAVGELIFHNRYGYANGNPVNFRDPSGLFSCSKEENPNVLAACGDLDQAMQRGSQRVPVISNLEDATSDGFVQLKQLVQTARGIFGVRFQAPGSLAGVEGLIDLDDCTKQILAPLNVSLAKTDVLRSIAAMVHIVSRFAEAGIPDATGRFRSAIGDNNIQFFGQDINPDKVGVCTGFVQLEAQGNRDIQLGTGVTVATIVHELGHAFDRAVGQIPSRTMLGLRYSTGQQRFFPSGTEFPVDAPGLQANWGMFTRANPSTDQKEVWADMFMSWVLDGINTPTACDNSSRPGWNCATGTDSSFATMRLVYTGSAVRRILGFGSGASFDEDFLRNVETVSRATRRPCG